MKVKELRELLARFDSDSSVLLMQGTGASTWFEGVELRRINVAWDGQRHVKATGPYDKGTEVAAVVVGGGVV